VPDEHLVCPLIGEIGGTKPDDSRKPIITVLFMAMGVKLFLAPAVNPKETRVLRAYPNEARKAAPFDKERDL
jgi:hypothetical protein